MKTLIKEIRLATGMNQEQFANALGTTPLSINRLCKGAISSTTSAYSSMSCLTIMCGDRVPSSRISHNTATAPPRPARDYPSGAPWSLPTKDWIRWRSCARFTVTILRSSPTRRCATTSRHIRANRCRTSSPQGWPNASLICLK